MVAMQLLMEQMFGRSVSTLRSIVSKEEFSFAWSDKIIRSRHI